MTWTPAPIIVLTGYAMTSPGIAMTENSAPMIFATRFWVALIPQLTAMMMETPARIIAIL